MEKVLLRGAGGENSGETQGWRSMSVNTSPYATGKDHGAESKERRGSDDLHKMENSPAEWGLGNMLKEGTKEGTTPRTCTLTSQPKTGSKMKWKEKEHCYNNSVSSSEFPAKFLFQGFHTRMCVVN